MKKQYIVLSIFLISIIFIISFSIYIARQTLKRNLPREENRTALHDSYLSSPGISIPPAVENVSIPQKEEKSKDPEVDLENIPDEFFSEDNLNVINQISEAEIVEGEKPLNKKPSLNSLKDLKFKGVVIY